MRDCVHGDLTIGAELRCEGASTLIKSACTPNACCSPSYNEKGRVIKG